MATRINTNDPRAIKLLDAAGIEYTIEASERSQLVTPASDFWTIGNIHYRGNILTADLSNKLLPVRTQQQHAAHRDSAVKGEFVTADLPFYIAMFDALFKQKDFLEYAQQARDFIQETLRNRFPITLTRPSYSTRGKDIVTHNYGTKDSYQTKADIIGPDRVICRADRDTTNAVLGTNNIGRLHKVFNWLNGTDLSIYRFNEKPKELTDAVARFYASPDDARIHCVRHPDSAYASLGVRVNARSASKK